MADALRTSVYQIISAFQADMQANAKASDLEKNWIMNGKPLYGTREILVQKLVLFLEFHANWNFVFGYFFFLNSCLLRGWQMWIDSSVVEEICSSLSQNGGVLYPRFFLREFRGVGLVFILELYTPKTSIMKKVLLIEGWNFSLIWVYCDNYCLIMSRLLIHAFCNSIGFKWFAILTPVSLEFSLLSNWYFYVLYSYLSIHVG